MELIDLIEEEIILNYEVALKNKSLKNFLLFFEKNCPEVMGEIEKDYYLHFIQDIWSLLELIKNNQFLFMNEGGTLKETRQFLIETIAYHEQIMKNIPFFSVSPIRNFIVASVIVKKIDKWFYNEVDFFSLIQTEFSGNNGTVHKHELIIEGFRQIEKHYLQPFNHFLEKAIIHTIEQITAAEKLLGNTFWSELNLHEIDQLFQSLDSNHFSEVLFLKEKMTTAEFVTFHKKTANISDSTFLFCVQQDQSMQALGNLQISIALTLLELSKQCNHDFIYLPFAHNLNQETVILKGELDIQKYFEMNEAFIGGEGAIHYKKAINFAFTLLKLELSSASGKIYLLCNERLFDYCPAEDYWKDAVLKFKSEKDIEITVIYTGKKELLAPIWFADHVFTLDESVVLH
ncbi:hypothetical protein CSE16_06535 [Solibacillus sp. R5-41]|uniref:hypothetical protein n=1 Tax=Solibacillus sp. R5-41 TaxID=2048654 RepID=UPI000C124E70|nr:hypothetical protein [Solibacillus sp. R5-41]ATP39735.1 hypothetical protein CSE16_06535 [Solibacillus sp. R5-41]